MICCVFCGKSFKYLGFANHVRLCHNISSKEYYDTYLKKEKEGICLKCSAPTNFKNINMGYYEYCSSKCVASSNKTKEKAKETRKNK
ncbi:MAG: hypothetical protein ACOC1O_03545, partial [bacterium]